MVQINDIHLYMFANTDEMGSLTGLIRKKKHFSSVHVLFLLSFGPFCTNMGQGNFAVLFQTFHLVAKRGTVYFCNTVYFSYYIWKLKWCLSSLGEGGGHCWLLFTPLHPQKPLLHSSFYYDSTTLHPFSCIFIFWGAATWFYVPHPSLLRAIADSRSAF